MSLTHHRLRSCMHMYDFSVKIYTYLKLELSILVTQQHVDYARTLSILPNNRLKIPLTFLQHAMPSQISVPEYSYNMK